ncbi:hypothetical protein R9X41_23555 [Xylophilus sp. GOD-11R]|nr:hypothetical protein [Xylophilus sp. GOD-11R]WPB57067.1 hypothetical protein R9X41_23555 [Xylophilus sp. GOD-11R]
MSHIGYDYDKTVIAKLSGVNVLVGGDSHPCSARAACRPTAWAARLAPTRPARPTGDGRQVCLVHAGEYAQVVGELKVSFDAAGNVTACAGTPHVLIGDDFTIAAVAASGGTAAVPVAPVSTAQRAVVLDSDVFQTYIDRQPKNTAGLPVLTRLDSSLYSTKRYVQP